MVLRTAGVGDLAAVGELHHRSRTAAYAGLVSPAGLAAGSAAAMGEWWTERWRWERDTHRLTVAVRDAAPGGSRVVGFSYVGPSETAGAVELYAIHVDPALVGGGVGQALMVGALADLADLANPAGLANPAEPADPAGPAGPADRAVLWVLAGNARARRFYERGGWVSDGATRDSPIGPETVAQLRYARDLP